MGSTAWKLLAILAVVGPIGCSDPTAPGTQDLLEGDWTWVESSGGIAGVTRTPESTGETMSLRFLSGSSVEVTRNGSVEGTTTYELVSSADGATTTIQYAQGIFGFASQGLSVTQGVLILIDGCCDGFTYRFERAS